MLRNAVSAYGARLSLGAAAVAAPVAVAQCAKDGKKSVTSSFDPEALERGAKALREINSSVHAKRVRSSRSERRDKTPPRARPPRVAFVRFADRRVVDRSARANRKSRARLLLSVRRCRGASDLAPPKRRTAERLPNATLT